MLSRLCAYPGPGVDGNEILRNGRYGGRESRGLSWEGGREDVGVVGTRPAGEDDRGEGGKFAINDEGGVLVLESLVRVRLRAGNWGRSIWRSGPRVSGAPASLTIVVSRRFAEKGLIYYVSC